VHLALKRVLEDEQMTLCDVEFIPVTPDIEVASYARMFEAAAALGARCVTVSGDDADPVRLAVNLAKLCELAARFGLRVDLEFMRWRHVGTLAQGRAAIERAASSNLALLVDALHLSRSGGSPQDLRGLPPGMVRAVQLCDAPAVAPVADDATIFEARNGRLPPGEGALPLSDLLHVLSPDTTLSVEMPHPALGAEQRLVRAYRGMLAVLARAATTTAGAATAQKETTR
jgi:sugar phosphate isomerase/epimerase